MCVSDVYVGEGNFLSDSVCLNVTDTTCIPRVYHVYTLPRLSNKLRSRRLKIAGHCIRHPELLVSDLVSWEPMHGRAQQGRPRQSYLSMLLKEVGTNSKEELRTLMRDRDIWRGLSGVDRT